MIIYNSCAPLIKYKRGTGYQAPLILVVHRGFFTHATVQNGTFDGFYKQLFVLCSCFLGLFRDSFYILSLPCLYYALVVQSHVSEVSVCVCACACVRVMSINYDGFLFLMFYGDLLTYLIIKNQKESNVKQPVYQLPIISRHTEIFKFTITAIPKTKG